MPFFALCARGSPGLHASSAQVVVCGFTLLPGHAWEHRAQVRPVSPSGLRYAGAKTKTGKRTPVLELGHTKGPPSTHASSLLDVPTAAVGHSAAATTKLQRAMRPLPFKGPLLCTPSEPEGA